MSFFDSLKQTLSGAAQSMNTELKKYRSKDLMQAIVSSATLMAYADGEVSPAEKQKLLGYMRNSEQMSVFEADKVIETFNQCVGRFDFDTTIATGEVLQKTGPVQEQTRGAIDCPRVFGHCQCRWQI